MKLIYRIIKIAHLPDGQIRERIVEIINYTELAKEEINKKYDQEVATMASLYFPPSPYEYQPNRGIGYAVNIEAECYNPPGEGGMKTYVVRTTYRSSKEFLQAMKQNEDEHLLKLGDPQYPVNSFNIDGNSNISYEEWYYKLLYHYQIKFLTQYDYDSFISEILYTVGHRCLKEARKIALSLFNKEVERKKILNNTEGFNPNKGPTFILTIQLLKDWEYILTAERTTPLPCLAEDQQEERRIFLRNNLVYNKLDASPSTVNEIEDLWSADHLTVYDYKVMSPYKKYDLVKYIYNLQLIVKGGGEDSIEHIEEFTHHNLATAKREALKVYRKKVQDLQNKYSPDILDNADANVIGYNYYLELKMVRNDFRIITEASFSYDGTDITEKEEENRIFKDLKRENSFSTFVNNRKEKEE